MTLGDPRIYFSEDFGSQSLLYHFAITSINVYIENI